METRAVLRTFLASPGDVAAERGIASAIVDELNVSWSRFLGLALELVRWETHAWPGADIDPQALINRQVADDHELFIGIMWSRFGTPTGRAGSGTEEEFERAHARHLADHGSVRIMFYFKSAPPPAEVDPAQATQVMEFRQRIGREGVLWWAFESEQTFASLLRLHLSRQMQDFCTIHPSVNVGRPERPQGGTLSLWRRSPPLYGRIVGVLWYTRAFSQRIERFSGIFARGRAELREIDMRAPDALARIDAVARTTASELLALVENSRPVLAAFGKAFDDFMASVSKMAPLFVGRFGHRIIRNVILWQLRRLRAAIEFGIPPFEELRATMPNYAVLNPAFTEASPAAAAFFDDVLVAWRRALHLVDEAERTYQMF